MSVESRLAALDNFVTAEDPFNRLTGRVFLDAQAVIEWVRLGILERVLRLLPQVDDEPRFQIQDRAFNEVAGVLSGRFNAGSRQEVKDHLKSLGNLRVDDPVPSSSTLGARVTQLQDRIFVEAAEDPDEHPRRRHLGEAETLAVMELIAPGAVFVTADKDGIAVARSAGIGQPVIPFAFTAGVITTMEDVVEFWKFTCSGRRCVVEAGWNEDCVEALECRDMTEEASNRSPIHSKLLRAEDALRWTRQDVRALLSVLDARGE